MRPRVYKNFGWMGLDEVKEKLLLTPHPTQNFHTTSFNTPAPIYLFLMQDFKFLSSTHDFYLFLKLTW